MVAPIIPALSQTFSTSVQTVALIVPAYLIPYGVATLVYGLLALQANGADCQNSADPRSISRAGDGRH
ncbi:hypothetical protein LMG28614_00864 [Paraburkholderia ultramafica]|uniref:Uncharacterized protein n=1 Tax=Paraburkholderia ultramafica TaxID=1544867 RepID=A0A6S7B3C9_9BURK|nr:hypothetical protein LMG28614_00864 [Paraburkholderia ultramafica]